MDTRSRSTLKSNQTKSNRIKSVLFSPGVRGGVGELYVRSIMAYVCSLQGQQTRSLDGLLRCADIFIQNPGIIRFTAWWVGVCLLATGGRSSLSH